MGQTHHGVVVDGQRYAYIISGQRGVYCSPPTSACFAFDFETQRFSKLPSLPEGRYMPLVFLYEGRIHCISGSSFDRITPAKDHWSIAVSDGAATESEWRVEKSYDWARTHTASCLVGDQFYVLGGQMGDVPRIEGDPEYRCIFDTSEDTFFDEVFYIDLKTWERVDCASMPLPVAHSEHGVFLSEGKIFVAGGVLGRDKMCDRTFVYDVETDEWCDNERLPYFMKAKVTALWKDRVFIIGVQRSMSQTDLRPGDVINSVWSMPYRQI